MYGYMEPNPNIGGGAVYGNWTVTSCTFSGNTSNGPGGAIYGGWTITNCIFLDNSAAGFSPIYGISSGGGAVYGNGTITNCTFSGNTAGNYGYGGAIFGGGTITSCILWGNSDGQGYPQVYDNSASLTVGYSDIDQDGYAGSNGNIRQDPLFVDPINSNFHIKGISPCINTATENGAPINDLEGTPRPQGAGLDMGAYEYTLNPTVISLSSFDAKPGNGSVTLNWVTESEVDNAGFNIYHAASENGQYIKINSSLIAAQGTSTQGAFYEFIDSSVQNRKTYYYKLEDIDLNGTSTMHGPVSAMPRLIFGIWD